MDKLNSRTFFLLHLSEIFLRRQLDIVCRNIIRNKNYITKSMLNVYSAKCLANKIFLTRMTKRIATKFIYIQIRGNSPNKRLARCSRPAHPNFNLVVSACRLDRIILLLLWLRINNLLSLAEKLLVEGEKEWYWKRFYLDLCVCECSSTFLTFFSPINFGQKVLFILRWGDRKTRF